MPDTKVDYLSADAAPLYKEAADKKPFMSLLWGDRVVVIEESGKRVKVRARGRENFGWVEKDALGGKPLLELYVMDVGQGDGFLVRTPNGRHLMVDGGLRRADQSAGKGAADFVDWKFFQDYADSRIKLDAMVATHCDADHYAGLMDLLEVDKEDELDCEEVCVEAIYHAGLGWWKTGKGRWLGPHEKVGDEDLFTQLVGDRAAIEADLTAGHDAELSGEWASFMRAAIGAQREDGTPTPIERIGQATGYLPEFGPGVEGEPAIKILAPLRREAGGNPALLRYTSEDSINTNGNCVVVRIDFGSTRILLTGDLNSASEDALLRDYAEHWDEFQSDVAKACHHGSADVSFNFLKALGAAVTVFSSGDNENYDHPNPTAISANAIAGHLEADGDKLLTPLIYSTELARSLKIEHGGPGKPNVVAGLVYGLVNVRTDGHRILCATRDEKDRRWRVATTHSRF